MLSGRASVGTIKISSPIGIVHQPLIRMDFFGHWVFKANLGVIIGAMGMCC